MGKDMDTGNERKQAAASLRAIKESLEYNMCDIESFMVAKYHSALDELQKTGIDVSDFRIPDSWIRGPGIPSIYSRQFAGPRVKRELFLIKLDSILEYLA
jgi:hypothetical protein